MPEPPPDPDEKVSLATERRIRWDALAAIIAAFVGLLALIVAGYTAHIQRQQVSAQVWPYLISGNNDLTQSLVVNNKGVGPAIVRSVQVRIDRKPQTDWNHVLVALGMPLHHSTHIQTTLDHEVLSPGEAVQVIRFPDKDLWQRFREAALDRMSMDICFCSTLGECWMSTDKNLIGPASMPMQTRVQPIDRCPTLPDDDAFNN